MNDHIKSENEDIFERLVSKISGAGSLQTVGIFQEFSSLHNLSEQVDFILDLLSKHNISPKYLKDLKSGETSSELRARGNKFYSQKNDEEAVKMYTYSIASAESQSENLGLAYANRSAVLFTLGLFEECLQDIERAFENNYPDSLKYKISDRKVKAFKLKSTQKKIPYYQKLPKIETNEKNLEIECASNSIKIENDPKQGRYLVATKDIEIGEVVIVEPPLFSVLTKFRWCHCYHCLVLCYNLIPCELCTKALFCSSKCKMDSKEYHKYECPILATIESLGYNSCRLLPLRIGIIQKNSSTTLQEHIGESTNVYKSGRYKEIHDLVTNQEHRSKLDIFERVSCTAMFYKVLKDHTDFFERHLNAKSNFISLLFRHLQIMACNFHDINELSLNPHGIYESEGIGAGAYSLLSLLNHSCAPNVCRTNYGTILCLSAIETIKKGEQLFDNYGFHFAIHPKSKRQSSLKKQYYFDCECRACNNDWNTFFNLKHSNQHTHFLEFQDKLSKADLEVARKIRPLLIKNMKKLEENIPCMEFYQEQEVLKQCDAIFGNLRRSFSDLKFT